MDGTQTLMKILENIPYKGGWRSDIKRDCLPGTPTDFLDYITDWVNNPDPKRGLVLFGQAGTGKSSVVYEIARRFRAMNHLTSYFIFLRAEQSKRKDYLFFTTLVHDLSSRYPSFKTALGKGIRGNKRLRTAQDYHTLFGYLLLQPLRDVYIIGPILIIIDALDESGDATDKNGLHAFLAKRLVELPSNVRILITSKPDVGIMCSFPNTSDTIQILYMGDSEHAAKTDSDIRVYLRKNLPLDKSTQYGDQLAKKAEGLFQGGGGLWIHLFSSTRTYQEWLYTWSFAS
jgi:hypothetical protein